MGSISINKGTKREQLNITGDDVLAPQKNIGKNCERKWLMLIDMLLTQVPSDPCTTKLSSDSGSELSDFSSGEIEEELETLKPAQVCFVVHLKSAWTSVVLACLLALLTCRCCGQLEDCFFMLWTVVCQLVACQNYHRVSCVGMGGFVVVAGF